MSGESLKTPIISTTPTNTVANTIISKQEKIDEIEIPLSKEQKTVKETIKTADATEENIESKTVEKETDTTGQQKRHKRTTKKTQSGITMIKAGETWTPEQLARKKWLASKEAFNKDLKERVFNRENKGILYRFLSIVGMRTGHYYLAIPQSIGIENTEKYLEKGLNEYIDINLKAAKNPLNGACKVIKFKFGDTVKNTKHSTSETMNDETTPKEQQEKAQSEIKMSPTSETEISKTKKEIFIQALKKTFNTSTDKNRLYWNLANEGLDQGLYLLAIPYIIGPENTEKILANGYGLNKYIDINFKAAMNPLNGACKVIKFKFGDTVKKDKD